jgi:phosphomevalonate kinase
LVLSGAYSVLYGAPALVTAVSRFAYADSEGEAVHVSEEVRCAVDRGLLVKPFRVNADELRTADGHGGSRKLGLGSSSAILLASLLAGDSSRAAPARREELFRLALQLHRAAQGGGSGADVAASTFGGTLVLRRATSAEELPAVEPFQLPSDSIVRVFAARDSAVTAAFVAKVKAYGEAEPEPFSALMKSAVAAAERARAARQAIELTDALRAQFAVLGELGDLAGVGIVTPEVRELGAAAIREGAALGPSGAGGGDVAFFHSQREPSPELIASAQALGYELLELDVGAPGASVWSGEVNAPRGVW